MKIVEINGTQEQQVYITIAPENEAEKALIQMLDQSEAVLSAGAELGGDDKQTGLLITASIKSHSYSQTISRVAVG